MKTYPARFVGEYTNDEWHRIGWTNIPNVGDVALVRGYADRLTEPHDTLFIRCACGSVDDNIAIAPAVNRQGASWSLTSREPVNIEPSIVSTVGPWTNESGQQETRRCHYFVHAGQLQMLDDTTSALP